MKSKHGPSLNRSSRKRLFKQLFGSDSDTSKNEQSPKKKHIVQHTQNELISTNNKNETEDDDVLEITVGNETIASPAHEDCVTPTKTHEVNNVPPLISPLANTPIHNRFVSPAKIQQLTHVKPLISPLAKTPIPVKEPTNSTVTRTPLAKTITPLKAVRNRPLFTSPISKNKQKLTAIEIIRKNLFASNSKQNALAQTTHPTDVHPNNNCKVLSRAQTHKAHDRRFREKQQYTRTLLDTESPYQHTPDNSTQQQQQPHTHTPTRTITHTPVYSNTQANKQVHTTTIQRTIYNYPRYETYIKQRAKAAENTFALLKRTHFSVQRTNQTQITEIRTRTQTQETAHTFNEEEHFVEKQLSFVTHNRHICKTSATGPIVDRHNFEREIRINVKNDFKRPITEVEKRIVETLQQHEQKPSPSSSTRVIELKNKNAPQGVHSAIAVDKNKYYSRNALKKLTRNLANQMS